MDPNTDKPQEPDNALDAVMAALEVAPDEGAEDAVIETPAEEVAAGDGEEVAAEVVAEEAATEAAATPEEAAKADADKAVDDEMKALGIEKPDSQKRFRELANEARDNREYRRMYEEQHEVFRHMQDAGIGGDQFGLMVGIAGDVNSGDPVRQERAYKALMAEAQALGQQLGYEVPGHDPLAAHNDLRQKVEDGLIDRDSALELARGRARTAATERHVTQRTAADNNAEAWNVARGQLNALEQELKAKDPQYSQKRAILEPQIQILAQSVSPKDLPRVYAELYGRLQLPAPVVPAAPPVRRPAPDNAGRPNGGGGDRQPKNAQEAVMLSLGIQLD